jgi:hypothetical protein
MNPGEMSLLAPSVVALQDHVRDRGMNGLTQDSPLLRSLTLYRTGARDLLRRKSPIFQLTQNPWCCCSIGRPA